MGRRADRKITKRTIDALKPVAGQIVTHYDSEVAGFLVRCHPSGSKVYGFKYRCAGEHRLRSIGRHGDHFTRDDQTLTWTPETARREAARLRGLVAGGRDPDEEDRRQTGVEMTVSRLTELYLERGVATKKPITVRFDRGRIDGHIKPHLGKRAVSSVTRQDVEEFMHKVAERKAMPDVRKTKKRGKVIIRGGKGAATRVMGLLGAIFEFAVREGYRTDNPVRGVKRYADGKRERPLSPAELTRLGQALVAAEKDGASPYAIAGIRLLALTGCRRGEIMGLRWDEVDLHHKCLRLTDSKTGPKPVLLGAPALELLSGLKRVDKNAFVLPASTGEGHLQSLNKVWLDVRKRAELHDVRLHDLRHGFASTGVSGGDSLYVVGSLLGHRDATTTQRYSHLAPDPIRAAAERISSQIAAAMTGKSADVKRLRRKHG